LGKRTTAWSAACPLLDHVIAIAKSWMTRSVQEWRSEPGGNPMTLHKRNDVSPQHNGSGR
jgi:hypothetical protein